MMKNIFSEGDKEIFQIIEDEKKVVKYGINLGTYREGDGRKIGLLVSLKMKGVGTTKLLLTIRNYMYICKNDNVPLKVRK